MEQMDFAWISSPAIRGSVLLALSILAAFSYIARIRWLRTLVLIVSLAYLGIATATFFSIFHLAGSLSLRPPLLKYNPLWWELIIIVAIFTLSFGRIWCGYLCPFGALQEFLGRIVPLKVRPSSSVDRGLKFVKYGFLLVILGLFFATGKINLANYEPFTTLFIRRGSLLGWTLVGLALGAAAVGDRFWCRYFCLAGATLALISKMSLTRLRIAGECGSCSICPDGCPMGAFDTVKGIAHSECIGCNRCRNLCRENLVNLRLAWRRRAPSTDNFTKIGKT